jgi:hypothetical protein
MEQGGVLGVGRCKEYPVRFFRIKRIYRKIIRTNYKRKERRWHFRGPNTRSLNKHRMHVLFAYELRPSFTPLPPPPVCEALPVDGEIEWRDAA